MIVHHLFMYVYRLLVFTYLIAAPHVSASKYAIPNTLVQQLNEECGCTLVNMQTYK